MLYILLKVLINKITILVHIFSARSNPKTLDVGLICKQIKTLDNGIVLDLPKR